MNLHEQPAFDDRMEFIRKKVRHKQRFYIGCAILITGIVGGFVTVKIMPFLRPPVEVVESSLDPRDVRPMRDLVHSHIPELFDPLGFNPVSDWRVFLSPREPRNHIRYFRDHGDHVIEIDRGYGVCGPSKSRFHLSKDDKMMFHLSDRSWSF